MEQIAQGSQTLDAVLHPTRCKVRPEPVVRVQIELDLRAVVVPVILSFLWGESRIRKPRSLRLCCCYLSCCVRPFSRLP
jgi:hypothetical protein